MKVLGQLEGAQLEQIGAATTTPASRGRIYLDITDPAAALIRYHDGTTWQQVAISSSVNVVHVMATNSAGTSMPTGITDVPYPTVAINRNTCFVGSTGVFTAPATGQYLFTASGSITLTDSTENYLSIASGAGTQLAVMHKFQKDALLTGSFTFGGSVLLTLASTATAKVRLFHNCGTTRTLDASALWNRLSIVQVA